MLSPLTNFSFSEQSPAILPMGGQPSANLPNHRHKRKCFNSVVFYEHPATLISFRLELDRREIFSSVEWYKRVSHTRRAIRLTILSAEALIIW